MMMSLVNVPIFCSKWDVGFGLVGNLSCTELSLFIEGQQEGPEG